MKSTSVKSSNEKSLNMKSSNKKSIKMKSTFHTYLTKLKKKNTLQDIHTSHRSDTSHMNNLNSHILKPLHCSTIQSSIKSSIKKNVSSDCLLSLPMIEKISISSSHGIEHSHRTSTGSTTSTALEIDVSDYQNHSIDEEEQFYEISSLTEEKIQDDNHCNLIRLVRIGSGSSAYVYKSVHFPSLTIVADKVIIVSSNEKRLQLIEELKSLRSTVHGSTSSASGNNKPSSANIVRLLEVYPNPRDGTISMCLEYMDGGSLQDVVRRGGCQCESVIAGIARQMLKGLAYLHSKRRIHRDIKPGNVLMCSGRGTTNGTDGAAVKISDFGLSKELEKGHSLADSFLGTFHYMSPERISGDDYSFSSDIWSFGMTILAVALGRYPFSPASPKVSLTEDAGYCIEGEGGYWAILQAIQERPSIRSLLQSCQHSCEGHTHSNSVSTTTAIQLFTRDFHSFLSLAMHRDQKKRPTASALLQHPFLTHATASVEEDTTKEFIIQCCARQSQYIESEYMDHLESANTTSVTKERSDVGGDKSVQLRRKSCQQHDDKGTQQQPQRPGIIHLRKVLKEYRKYINKMLVCSNESTTSAKSHSPHQRSKEDIHEFMAPLLEPSTVVNMSVQLNAPIRLVKKGFGKLVKDVTELADKGSDFDMGGLHDRNTVLEADPCELQFKLPGGRFRMSSGTMCQDLQGSATLAANRISHETNAVGHQDLTGVPYTSATAEIRELVSNERQRKYLSPLNNQKAHSTSVENDKSEKFPRVVPNYDKNENTRSMFCIRPALAVEKSSA